MNSAQRADAVIVGGGVIGLTTAVVLAERGLRIRVWARESGEATTSAVAGALWWPYRIRPAELVRGWSLRSLDAYERLAKDPGASGVRMVEGVLGETTLDEARDLVGDRLPDLRAATPGEYGGEGVRARLPLLDMPVHLAYLRRRLEDAGGVVEDRAVSALAEGFEAAPVVVNCTGLGARELVPDPLLTPVRGQLVVVENPGLETWVVSKAADGTMAYVFPQRDRVLLGGTAEDGVWSREPDPAEAAAIVRRCTALRPELAGARVLGHRVGLRPAREAVRLEREEPGEGRALVHNYGHGGAGVTVAWGCAEQAAALVEPGR
ncbi:FAD-dependent oxidoreductase [Streptomyces mangrovisoli]|uniref:D-amino-acid oxidase n=1 Tax=Streptomyces mangrovisoli TaxID=1428628 RepID=A0A1J4NWB4_9ACTN|nr:FAD-dependent oxidoreductase [Streptomyces mangrovisoli]OIJ66378.1 amino acid oxidase [Streptomyces mangrovisoli]